MTPLRNHIAAALTGLLLCPAFVSADANAAPQKVVATLDSAYIIMGKQTTLHIETTAQDDKDINLLLPPDTLTSQVEIIRVSADTSRLSNGMVSLKHDVVIQSFDSGLYAIPPVRVVMGADTLLSNHLVLKVIPVPVDSLQGQIHDFADVITPKRNIWDLFPTWIFGWVGWGILAVIIFALAFAAYYFLVVQKRNPFRRNIVVIPPYEEARDALDKLRSERLCENGHEREFYTRLTDILRVYLYRRFGISAMEMTSSQILHALSQNQETRWSRTTIEEVLSMADFVKFAKMRPLPDDNVKTFRNVSDFVERTRPVAEDDADKSDTDSKSTPITNK